MCSHRVKNFSVSGQRSKVLFKGPGKRVLRMRIFL